MCDIRHIIYFYTLVGLAKYSALRQLLPKDYLCHPWFLHLNLFLNKSMLTFCLIIKYLRLFKQCYMSSVISFH